MEKSAMQFLKDEIESKIIPSNKENGKLTDYQYGHNIAYSVVLTLAEYLIEVEKKQMLDFGLYVKKNGWVGCKIEDLYEDYNNQNK